MHPKDESLGNREMIFGRQLLIEAKAAKKCEIGKKVRLLQWGIATITGREELEDEKFELFATVDENAKEKRAKKLAWICNDPETTMEVKLVNSDKGIEEIGIAEKITSTIRLGRLCEFSRRGNYSVRQAAEDG